MILELITCYHFIYFYCIFIYIFLDNNYGFFFSDNIFIRICPIIFPSTLEGFFMLNIDIVLGQLNLVIHT